MKISIQPILEKPRFDRSEALAVAKELCDALKPVCSRLIVASSPRRALHRDGIPVDLSTATEDNWWNYVVCRTGPTPATSELPRKPEKAPAKKKVFTFVGPPYALPWERS